MDKFIKENDDLKSRLVSMDIARNELVWAIKQVGKKPDEYKEILEQKDRQVCCLLYENRYLVYQMCRYHLTPFISRDR